MRLALVSPFPPAKTGIADYSQALLEAMQKRADVDVISEPPIRFDTALYDAVYYQLGNNPWHAFVYELALQHPGISVLHEPNLHHLMTDLTIRRGRWDLYLEEAEYNGGAQALEYARRVKALEVGPDYDGLPMTRRLLESSRGVLVHNQFSAAQVRAQGFHGQLGVVPHGAWLPETSGFRWRVELGLDETTPLIGVFGFLKPYKRIAESLRAFRRLLRLEPRARMILVGEVHPDFPLATLIERLGIGPAVRLLGFTTEEEFSGFMAACDVVLNLRFPTVGESSGSLLRALGLGKAVLVSNIGSFAELPDNVCLKVPVDATEEDLIFEYLNLLVSRPEFARALGLRARRWVERECSWDYVASEYCRFGEAVRDGREWILPEPAPAATQSSTATGAIAALLDDAAPVAIATSFETEISTTNPESSTAEEPESEPLIPIEYIRGWAENDEARGYVETHKDRLVHTLELVPPGGPDDHILEMGAYLQITPALKTRLGYGHVRGCYYGPAGKVDEREIVSEDGEVFRCLIDNFDAEADRFPYPDECYSTVLCCELLEHLRADPMHMMSEINRITKPGGHLVLTTPNIASERALAAILQGYHPAFFPAYIKPAEEGETEARHAREYTPKETWQLLWYSGFDALKLETGEFLEQPHPELHWVSRLLERFRLPTDLRGDGIYILGRKRDLYASAIQRSFIVSLAMDHPAEIHVHAEVPNRGRETWTPLKGDAIGWQLFDPDSGSFLGEGKWELLASDVPPGSSAKVDLTIPLPPERAQYRIYISPVNTASGWLYSRGAQFLMVDAEVEGELTAASQPKLVTLGGLRRARTVENLKALFLSPFRIFWQNRALIASMVRRDYEARYRGSFADIFWTILNPLLLMLAYWFVFGVVLRARFPGDPSREGFVLYFLAGMLPWLAVSEALARSPNLLLEARNLIKKIRYPLVTLPGNVVFAGMITQGVATILFLVLVLALRGSIPLTALWVPALLIPQFLFTLGLSWLLSAFGVFLRDIVQIIGFVLTLWFFLTPICYPESSLPSGPITALLQWNPLLHIVRAWRSVLLEARMPDALPLAVLCAVSVGVFYLGYAIFYRLRRSFADVV